MVVIGQISCKAGFASLSLSIGNLYFANVQPTDGLEPGLQYLCAVFNRVLRGLVQGDDQRIDPVIVPGTVPANTAPFATPASPARPRRDR